MPSPNVVKQTVKQLGESAAKALTRDERLALGKAWTMSVGVKNPELARSAGFLYGRNAAAAFNNLDARHTIVYMTPEELEKVAGKVPPSKKKVGELDAVRLDGTIGADGGLRVTHTEGFDGLDHFVQHGEGRRIPVIVPRTESMVPQYISNAGRNVYGLRTKLDVDPLGQYRNQKGRSLELLAYALSDEGYPEFTFTPGASADVWHSLEVGMANAPRHTLRQQDVAQGLQQGRIDRLSKDLEIYKAMEAELGKDKFSKYKGAVRVTPRALYGDTAEQVLGEYADYPIIGWHVEEQAQIVPPAAQGIAARVGPMETGEHIGDFATSVATINKGRQSPRTYYERLKKDILTTKDPDERRFMQGRIKAYEDDLAFAKQGIEEAMGRVFGEGVSERDIKDLMRGVARWSKEWAKYGTTLTPRNWWSGPEGKGALKEVLSKDMDIPEDDARDIMRALSEYYTLAGDPDHTSHAYLMLHNNPLVIHDLNNNSASRVATFLKGMPEFEEFSEDLDKIINKQLGQGRGTNAIRAMESDALFEIMSRRGYDVLAYMNQAEGKLSVGGVSPSWIGPRNPGKSQPSLAKLTPKTAEEFNFKSVAAVLSPLLAAYISNSKEQK